MSPPSRGSALARGCEQGECARAPRRGGEGPVALGRGDRMSPPSRGRRTAEQGPHLWGCDSGAGQGASPAGPCASAGCGRSRRAQAWGGAAALRPGPTPPKAALCAPARTTLRETESGAHPQQAGAPLPRSDAPTCGDATVEPAKALPAGPRASAGCGRSRRAQAWGGAVALRPGPTPPKAALCAPGRTTLRETEPGARPPPASWGRSSALRRARACAGMRASRVRAGAEARWRAKPRWSKRRWHELGGISPDICQREAP